MSFLKNNLFFLLLALSVGYIQCAGNDSSKNNNGLSASEKGLAVALAAAVDPTVRPEKLSVLPPMPQVQVAHQIQVVQPAQASVLTMPTGTTIEIPATAFVDDAGTPVIKPVEIRFREFHRPAEIIASGIPMKVRAQNGHEEWMQTAGMFEIEGFCEGKPVKVAPGKELVVNLVSSSPGEYDAWFFDPVAGNWQDVGNSKPQPNRAVAPLVSDLLKLRALVAKAFPEAPKASEKGKPSLDFNIDVSKFPELRKLQGIVWQYAGSDPALDPANNKWIRSTPWIEAKLEAGHQPNQYQLTLVGEQKDYSIPVQPTLSGVSLEKAQEAYNQALQAYEANKALLKEKELVAAEQSAFSRTLAVKGFGIHNYDILWKQPDAIPIIADFDFGPLPLEIKKMVTVYLITGNGRTVVGLPFYDWSNFRFSPGADNKLVAMIPGNRMATFDQADFNAEMGNLKKAANNQYVFKMKVQEAPIASVADLGERIYSK